MSRIARVVVPGIPHHITQRGNSRQNVFRCDTDRRVYLDLYREYSARFRLATWGYCLMDNHIHLLAVPERQTSLAKTLGRLQSDYARYFNVRYGKCGHLWEARYFSCPIDDDRVWTALRYIERNPVQAGMIDDAVDWRWSSARAHAIGEDPERFLSMAAWRDIYHPSDWQVELGAAMLDAPAIRELRDATLRGRPFGSTEFVERLERELDRALFAKPVGRPRKRQDSAVPEQVEIGV